MTVWFSAVAIQSPLSGREVYERALSRKVKHNALLISNDDEFAKELV